MAEIVYLLLNPAMHGLLKIGKTDAEDVSVRMKALYTSGVPVPFDCIYACEVENNETVEKALHKTFADRRVNPKREFFALYPTEAITEMKKYELKDVTPQFRERFDSPLLDAECDARRQTRRASINVDPLFADTKNLHSEIKRPRKGAGGSR